MKKTLVALTAATALAAAGTIAVPQKAEAYAWWVIPSVVVGAAVVGGTVIANSQAHAAYYGAPYGGPYYAPAGARGTVSVTPRGCYMQAQPALFGGYRYVEVCR